MLFAALEFSDFALIALIVTVCAGCGAAASSRTANTGQRRGLQDVRRIEEKVDLILTHLGIEYVAPPVDVWQELATDPAQKIAAIKAYREKYGVGLAEAKAAVEEYIRDGR